MSDSPRTETGKDVRRGAWYCAIVFSVAAMTSGGCNMRSYDLYDPYESEKFLPRRVKLPLPGDGPYLVLETRNALLLFTEFDCGFYFQRLEEEQPGHLISRHSLAHGRSQQELVREALKDLDATRPPLDNSYAGVRDFKEMAAQLLQWGKGSVYHKTRQGYIRRITVMESTKEMSRRFETADMGELLLQVEVEMMGPNFDTRSP